jgi:predicted nuclease of predicted toxin-antitoxin system
MRLLANENVPGPLVRALVDAGCDVSWIRTASPGASDREVLALAIQEERILLTFDKDFGEIARAARLPAKCGVILLRVPMPPPREIARLAVLILSGNDWAGRFSVVEPGRIRSRPLEIQ